MFLREFCKYYKNGRLNNKVERNCNPTPDFSDEIKSDFILYLNLIIYLFLVSNGLKYFKHSNFQKFRQLSHLHFLILAFSLFWK